MTTTNNATVQPLFLKLPAISHLKHIHCTIILLY
jgi:hypothetical protein